MAVGGRFSNGCHRSGPQNPPGIAPSLIPVPAGPAATLLFRDPAVPLPRTGDRPGTGGTRGRPDGSRAGRAAISRGSAPAATPRCRGVRHGGPAACPGDGPAHSSDRIARDRRGRKPPNLNRGSGFDERKSAARFSSWDRPECAGDDGLAVGSVGPPADRAPGPRRAATAAGSVGRRIGLGGPAIGRRLGAIRWVPVLAQWFGHRSGRKAGQVDRSESVRRARPTLTDRAAGPGRAIGAAGDRSSEAHAFGADPIGATSRSSREPCPRRPPQYPVGHPPVFRLRAATSDPRGMGTRPHEARMMLSISY